QQLGYRELNEKANRLAHHLREQGVKADSLVGLCVNRSLDMMIGLLAILKAGGAYVPLDPDYPQSRLTHMVNDSGIKILLCEKSLIGTIDIGALTAVCLDDENLPQILADHSTDNPSRTLAQNPANRAYVIYTSGSTGKPKGVEVEHQNLTCRLGYIDKLLALGSGDSVPSIASFAFDISLIELIYPLTCGAQVLLLPLSTIKDVALLAHKLVGCRFIHMVPSLAQVWLEQINGADYDQLKYFATGGDAVPPSLIMALGETLKQSKVLQFYGPTETTLFGTCHPDAVSLPTSLGKAIDNTTLYILDNNDQLVPFGAVGQLHIGGPTVSRGYLNRPELTAKQFITHPFIDGQRIYRTGDLVRYLPDGNLAFIGRVDSQVKIRGFRIEIGEVEHQLAKCDDVAAALVLAREDQPGNKRLVGYVVAHKGKHVAISRLREQLVANLPEYMVPSAFVVLDQWPLSANDKIDRKALPAPDSVALQGEYIAPASETEAKLVQIWSDLLKTKAVTLSASANFFESGGHSLLTVRLVGEVRAQLQVELAIRDVFATPQLSQLAQLIDKSSAATRSAVVAIKRQSNQLPSSFAQQRLWFIDQMDGGSSQYNMPSALCFEGLFDEKVVEQAFTRIIERHEPLRTVFVNSEDGVQQLIREDVEFKLTLLDLSAVAEQAQKDAVQQAVQADAQRVFDLAEDLMLASTFIRLSPNNGVLLFNMHHIASDGWSMGLLENEFIGQYQAISQDKINPFAPLLIQYADYAQWQREWLQGEVLTSQLDYWQQQLADLPQVHSLPLDRARPKIQRFEGAHVSLEVAHYTFKGLKQLASSQDTTLFMVLHGAFSLLLSRHSNCADIVVGVPVANRLQKELEPIIGFFINTLVLRSDCAGNPSFSDYLAQIKTTNLDAQANQDVPFEYLVERLKPARSTAHSPLFQIMFSMDEQEAALELPGVTLSPLNDAMTNADNHVVAKFELTLCATVAEHGLSLSFEYNTDLFDAKTITRFGADLHRLLVGVVANPQSGINELPMLSDQEQQYLRHTLNKTQSTPATSLCIHQQFERQAKQTPQNIALVFEHQQLSYQSLNEKANQLAHYLIDQGVKPDSLVGLCVTRSLDMVIGILAILKAGGAYVPLDSNYPQSRLDYMVQDSGIKLMLSQKALQKTADGLSTVCLDDDNLQHQLRDQSRSNPKRIAQQCAGDLAYVIYTSGSTGQPKGVMIEHQAIGAHITAVIEAFGFNETDQVLQFASVSFDTFVEQSFAALCVGATLHLRADDVWSASQFFDYTNQKNISVTDLSPSYLMALLIDDHSSKTYWPDTTLTRIVVGGEALQSGTVERWFALDGAQSCRLFNAYGPTEVTITSTLAEIKQQHNQVSIGRPFTGRQVYILNEVQQLVPNGTVGELYIGGCHLARGYLNQPQLTAERFIVNPFSDDTNARLYKTGDLVRYLAD
ncbi:MAG: amino acid adenylation domain-containing protein, partial [Algicola sp.]|nr:amino acid adenylation domain-containing protein [Algicola sp.]